jgi:outer membrane protein assembly factor BamB
VADGTVLWHRRYRTAEALVVASTPDAVIANVDGEVVAFDARTGEPVWTLADAHVTAASASGSTLFVTLAVRPDRIGAISGTDGSELWRRPLRLRDEPLLSRGILLVPARTDGGACLLGLDPADGSTVWRRAQRGRDELQIASGDTAFVLTRIGRRRSG